jgi:hypothetical protein
MDYMQREVIDGRRPTKRVKVAAAASLQQGTCQG